MNRESQLVILIGLLYECAIDPSGWNAFLTKLSQELNSPGAIYFIQNPVSRQLLGLYHAGLPEEGVAEYGEHYVSVHLRLKAIIQRPVGTVAVESDLVPSELYRRSELVNDFLLRYDKFCHVLGGLILKDPTAVAVIGLQRQLQQGPFEESDIQLLRELQPHLRRASRLMLKMAEREAYEKGLTEALDFLPIGVVLVNEDSKILAANRQAGLILRNEDGLSTFQGRLCGARPAETNEFRKLIAEASQTSRGQGFSSGGVLSLPRPSLRRDLSILVAPVPASEYRDTTIHPSAVVFISDPEDGTETSDEMLRRLYGLTRAEARLASVLMEGTSMREAGERLGITYETARSQLKSVFLKTETSSQSELVGLLLRSPAGLSFGPTRSNHFQGETKTI